METTPEPSQRHDEVVRSVEERLLALEGQFVQLRREWRSIALEWEDSYEKMRTLYNRISRRFERAAKAEAEAPEQHQPNPAALALLAGHDVKGHL